MLNYIIHNIIYLKLIYFIDTFGIYKKEILGMENGQNR